MARGPAVKIILGDSERSELEMRARRRKIARADAVRAEIVLLAADGVNNCAIAAALGVSRLTVGLWRMRFAKKRFDGLDYEPRCGALARSETRRSPLHNARTRDFLRVSEDMSRRCRAVTSANLRSPMLS